MDNCSSSSSSSLTTMESSPMCRKLMNRLKNRSNFSSIEKESAEIESEIWMLASAAASTILLQLASVMSPLAASTAVRYLSRILTNTLSNIPQKSRSNLMSFQMSFSLFLIFLISFFCIMSLPTINAQTMKKIRAPDDCWSGGWSPEICCSSPGAQGNPLCWDHIYTYEKCCTDTIEGQRFNYKRMEYVKEMEKRGAYVNFEITQIKGTGRSGALALEKVNRHDEILRVPLNLTYGLVNIPQKILNFSEDCDPHAKIALGLLDEEMKGSESSFESWIDLLPKNFANLLWYNQEQRNLVRSTFFNYVLEDWDKQIACMEKAYITIWPERSGKNYKRLRKYSIRWAFSIVKTRGFAFDTNRNSTLLIPLADFLNHHPNANVRTPDPLEDSEYISFRSSADFGKSTEMCIEYSQASNLEFMIRYGFKVENNPYGGRHFDLSGEPLQAYCPGIILRYDLPEVVANSTVDCHRQARYLSYQQRFPDTTKKSTIISEEDRRGQDIAIYSAIQSACLDLLKELESKDTEIKDPKSGKITKVKNKIPLVWYEKNTNDPITHSLVNEIRTERRLLQKCIDEFYSRKIRSDQVSPVNDDTIKIAKRIANEILEKYTDPEL